MGEQEGNLLIKTRLVLADKPFPRLLKIHDQNGDHFFIVDFENHPITDNYLDWDKVEKRALEALKESPTTNHFSFQGSFIDPLESEPDWIKLPWQDNPN